jgi:hypothetical protein
MLKGAAKRDYMRDYMRRRRAGRAAKPEPQAKPTAAKAEDDGEVARLKDELARERTRSKMLEEAVRIASRQQRALSAPKAAKPPLPPDEVRDRRIKALSTENRKLKWELREMENHYKDGLAKVGGMAFATQSLIAKCLHPDSRDQATEADKDRACKLFTAWKADKDKARRKA